MKLLLDTHTFIWWDSEPARLSPQALALCQDRQNVLLLSVVSVWEMQIKLQLSKLRLALPLKEIIETQQQTIGSAADCPGPCRADADCVSRPRI